VGFKPPISQYFQKGEDFGGDAERECRKGEYLKIENKIKKQL
jgi:hypothetical protein